MNPIRSKVNLIVGLLAIFIFSLFIGASEVESGYKEGIFVKTKDGKYELKINARIQFLGYYSSFENKIPSEKGFSIRRARLYFKGNGFYPWLKYYTQLTMEGDKISLRDFYLDFEKNKKISPKIGQYKVPFNREFLTSSADLQLVDRSIINNEFEVGRDIGMSLVGNFNSRFNYFIGIFNGSGKYYKNLDKDLLYAGRVMWTPAGELKYSQSSLEYPENPIFALGAAFAYFPGYEPLKENSEDRKTLSNAVKTVSTGTSDVSQFVLDFAFKYKGFSLEGDYHYRNITPEELSAKKLESYGFRIQGGYLFESKRWEIALRYSSLDPNISKENDIQKEITAGLNYFIQRHKLKIQGDYSYLIKEIGNRKEKETRLRTQLQFYF
ncbi:MAG: porin [Acidobacteriota bacterium]